MTDQATLIRLATYVQSFRLFLGKDAVEMVHDERGQRLLGAIEMCSEDWIVCLKELPGARSAHEAGIRSGGYWLTHRADIVRSDGGSFSPVQATSFLRDLRLFLSFANGLHTAVPFAFGFADDDREKFRDIGSQLDAPWQDRLGWFDTLHGQALRDVFTPFVRLLRDQDFGDTVRQALYWYLHSNRAGNGVGTDGSLILSVAALEGLSLSHVEKFNVKIKAGLNARLSALLAHLDIPNELPTHMKGLQSGALAKEWQTAIDAILKVRNELVHPRRRITIPLGGLVSEAWNLAQWYIEVIVLRLAGYDGKYGNRLARRWRGEVTDLPRPPAPGAA